MSRHTCPKIRETCKDRQHTWENEAWPVGTESSATVREKKREPGRTEHRSLYFKFLSPQTSSFKVDPGASFQMYSFLMASLFLLHQNPFSSLFVFPALPGVFADLLQPSLSIHSLELSSSFCFCHLTLRFSCFPQSFTEQFCVWDLCVAENGLIGASVSAVPGPNPWLPTDSFC